MEIITDKNVNEALTINIGDLKFAPYISSSQIEEMVKQMASQINTHYKGYQKPPVFLITLSGAMMFAAELSKHIDFLIEWAFIKCSSYGDSDKSCGCVKFIIEPTADLAGRDVIVIEDIVETGLTWIAMRDKLTQIGAKSVAIATMLLKKEVYKYPTIKLDYVGMEIDNKFVVGYGLDYGGLGRNLNRIYKLTDE